MRWSASVAVPRTARISIGHAVQLFHNCGFRCVRLEREERKHAGGTPDGRVDDML